MADEFFSAFTGLHSAPEGIADGHGAGGHMWTEQGTGVVDLGPPTVSANGDGIMDTCTVATDHDITVYTDVDHDGVADYAYRVDHEGHYERWHFAADATSNAQPSGDRHGVHGHWEMMDSGQLL